MINASPTKNEEKENLNMPVTLFMDSLGSDEEADFNSWCATNPDGFVLNPASAGGPMLHKASCGHLTWEEETHSMTHTAKAVAHLRDALEAFSEQQYGNKTTDCKSCKPQ
jgi:hypothetical protein